MKKVKGLRWWIVSLVALATVINYVDRSALAIMWPSIEGDVGLGKEDYAFIGIMFTIAYAISQSLSGKLYDKIGTRLGFIVSIVVWSISVGLLGVARSLASFSLLDFYLVLEKQATGLVQLNQTLNGFRLKREHLHRAFLTLVHQWVQLYLHH